MNMSWKYIMALTLALALLLPASRALAGVAANTNIFTEAKLTYHDGTSEKESTASVTVKIALVPALATLNEPPDQFAVYASSDTETGYSYTVRAGGNGPDDYTLAVEITDSGNIASGSSAEIEGQSNPYEFRLGASITTIGSSTTEILVPSDGEANSGVNGIEAGDFLVINDVVVEVDSVNDPTTGTASIFLKEALADAPGAGVSVWEQRTFNIKVASGTIDTEGESITLLVKASVTNSAGAVTDEVLNTFTSGAAVLTKYARNITTTAHNNNGTGGKTFTVNGSSATYYRADILAKQNDLIEYVLEVQNAGTAPVNDCDIHDILPSAEFVDLLTGFYGGKDFLYIDEGGAESTLTAVADGDTATVDGPNITFYVGTGADSSAGGSIDTGKNVKVVYRVKVK